MGSLLTFYNITPHSLFNPKFDLNFWCDATDSSTVSTDGSNRMITWTDKIGGLQWQPVGGDADAAKAVYNSSTGRFAFNGTQRATCPFDASMDDLASGNGVRIVMVLENKGAPGNESSPFTSWIISQGSDGYNFQWRLLLENYSSGEQDLRVNTSYNSGASTGDYTSGDALIIDDKFCIVEFDYCGENPVQHPYVCVNGQEVGMPKFNTNTPAIDGTLTTGSFPLYLGAAEGGAVAGANFEVAEIHVTKGGLSPAKRISQRQYLRRKHGITLDRTPVLTPAVLMNYQSNTLGLAARANSSEAYISGGLAIPNAHIFQPNLTSVAPLQAGTNNYANDANSFGPEMTLMKAMASFKQQVMVFKDATGDTNLDVDWDAASRALTPNKYQDFWRLVVSYGKARALNAGYEIDVVASYLGGGEADSDNEPEADAHYDNLSGHVDTHRSDVTNSLMNSNGDIAIITPLISGNPAAVPYASTVNAAKTLVASEKDKVFTIDTSAFGRIDDVHYNAAGQEDLGRLIFDNGVRQEIGVVETVAE